MKQIVIQRLVQKIYVAHTRAMDLRREINQLCVPGLYEIGKHLEVETILSSLLQQSLLLLDDLVVVGDGLRVGGMKRNCATIEKVAEARGTPVRFRVRIDSEPPGAAHGADVDDQGDGTLTDPRLYQLIRQPGPITERTFEITFLDPGVQAYAFTFG